MAMVKYLVALALLVAVVQACTHNGITYKEGEQYQDDCNTCTCGSNGQGGCHLKGCPPKVCSDGGKMYGVGESWLSSDGCNICTCASSGATGCTYAAC